MKILKSVFIPLLLLFIFWISFADNCIQKELWDLTPANICVNIKGNGNNQYINITATCEGIWCYAQHCIMGNGLNWCNRLDVNYNSLTTNELLVYIELDGIGTNYFFRWKYDFQNQTWVDDEELNNYNDTQNSSYLDVSAKTWIRVWDPIDLTVKTTEDYVWKITISSSSFLYPWEVTWTTLFPRQKDPIITSNDFDRYANRHNNGFFLKYSDEWREGYFNIEPSDNWRKILHDFVTFAKEGVYSVSFTNSDWKGDSITFFVSGVNNNIYRSCWDWDWLTLEDCEKLLENFWDWSNINDYSGDSMEWQIEDKNNDVIDLEETTNTLTWKIDMSWYEEWNQNTILSNWYSRELNNAYKFAYINWITTMENIEQANMKWNLNRISMAKMLSQYAINILKKTPDINKKCNFSDVTMQMDSDFSNWVTLACQLWIMWVWMSEFRPNDDVTRAEFWTALSRMLFWLSDWTDQYYSAHLAKLKKEWIISNDDPTLKELRWYVMLMLMRSAK